MSQKDRKKRAKNQKLFLVDIKNTESICEKHFSVMGTTGNIYNIKVNVDNQNCNCPDYIRRRLPCKHVYFVFIKVLKASKNYENYLDESLLMELFDNLDKLTNRLYASEELRVAYICQIKQDSKTNQNNNFGTKVQKKDDNCPVCMDDLENGEAVDFCKFGCGKSIHSECFIMWCKKNPSGERRCVYCRTEWEKKEKGRKKAYGVDSDFPAEYFNVYEATNKEQPARQYLNPFWANRHRRKRDYYYEKRYGYNGLYSADSIEEEEQEEDKEEESEGK